MSNPLHSDVTSRRDVGNAHRELASELRAAGIATPELDARLLICHACGISTERFVSSPERVVSDDELDRIRSAAARRRAREPVSRITGTREFWGLDFEIGPETLDPRADTETLVSAVLEVVREGDVQHPLSILDLGTGSGCILISLLHELRHATGVGTDISQQALEMARANAGRHAVQQRAQFLKADWRVGFNRPFDLITSNPPYIPAGDLAELEPEVALYEPRRALDGGGDGLDAYRSIIPLLPELLAPEGWALFEVGTGQADAVGAMLQDTPASMILSQTQVWRDLAGRVRCIAVKRSPRP